MERMELGQKLMYLIDHRVHHIKKDGTKVMLTPYQIEKDINIKAYALGLYRKGTNPQNRTLKKLLGYLDVSIDFVEAIGEDSTTLRSAKNEPLQYNETTINETTQNLNEMIYQLNARIAILEKYSMKLEKENERLESEVQNLKTSLKMEDPLKQSGVA